MTKISMALQRGMRKSQTTRQKRVVTRETPSLSLRPLAHLKTLSIVTPTLRTLLVPLHLPLIPLLQFKGLHKPTKASHLDMLMKIPS